MAPRDQAPPHNQADPKAASGGPFSAGPVTYAEAAEQLLDNGYAPLPIVPCTKKPALPRWTEVPVTEREVADWIRRYPDYGIGLRTGSLVGLDIDILDADLAWQVAALAQQRLGTTLIRVGLDPKRLLLYRTDHPFQKIDIKPVEVLGQGQQFVAFGIHATTRQPYRWPLGETPLEVPLDELPCVSEAQLLALVAEVQAIVPGMGGSQRRRGTASAGPISGPLRDETGRVTDGRDAWLSQLAYHAVHDALDRGDALDADMLATAVWQAFEASTDLQRARQDGGRTWSPHDALRKVGDKLRLQQEGRLPPRQRCDIEADYTAPEATIEAAREELDAVLTRACDRILAWHRGDVEAALPCIGIRATVGLGKSSASRRHLAALREELRAIGAPDRVLVFTPSHELADETAAAWATNGASVAVLRGYERAHPILREPMCRDSEAVKAAIAAGLDPQNTVCATREGARCPFFAGCLKQANRAEVQTADVVVAPYDALYTGFAVDPETVGLLVVDEGCWARAVKRTGGLTLEGLTTDLTGDLGTGMRRTRAAAQIADRLAFRSKLQKALAANGPGTLGKRALQQAGLTNDDCTAATRLEQQLIADPGLAPGLVGTARERAFRVARETARIRDRIALWDAVRRLLARAGESDGQLRVGAHDPGTGTHRIHLTTAAQVHPNFRDMPLLHLDATLRPEIAGRLLPGIEITSVEAAAPHMAVHLVSGRFGKTALVPDERAGAEENRRRANNRADCVTHVRWLARRLAPGRLLVVTYKDAEAAFADIPGVEVAHFNAIAGLDSFGDVAGLVVIGRPLPRDTDLLDPCAALLHKPVTGGYEKAWTAVRMRDGTSRAVRVTRHQDADAEVLRAAICDDELIQAIGRGRGVNRTSATPLEVHVLADVALPLVHDTVTAWETMQPDVVQRMLLDGVAVDSPGDAVVLHAGLFGTANAAKLQFRRIGFKGQIPISTYRGMTLKSAAYRRGGRGRSRQHAYWLDGDAKDVRRALEDQLGILDGWTPANSG